MIIEILYNILSFTDMIVSSWWLAFVIMPFLGFWIFKDFSETEEKGFRAMLPSSLNLIIVFFQTILATILLYFFIYLAIGFVLNQLSDAVGRSAVSELIQSDNNENILLDGKKIVNSKVLLDSFLNIKSYSSHRELSGKVSSPLYFKHTISIDNKEIKFYQDSAIEYEYWVYFGKYGHIGQIDTGYFIESNRFQKIMTEKELKKEISDEKSYNRKVYFLLAFVFAVIGFVAYDALFNKNHLSIKEKKKAWRGFTLFVALYIFLLSIAFSFSAFILFVILFYNFLSTYFCEKCGYINHKDIFKSETRYCSRCEYPKN